MLVRKLHSIVREFTVEQDTVEAKDEALKDCQCNFDSLPLEDE